MKGRTALVVSLVSVMTAAAAVSFGLGTAIGGPGGAATPPQQWPPGVGIHESSKAPASGDLLGNRSYAAASIAQAFVQLSPCPITSPPQEILLEGPTRIHTGPVDDNGSGQKTVDTEILSMDLTGHSPQLGNVVLRESPSQASQGRIVDNRRKNDFPADSFFDVFFEVDIQQGPSGNIQLHNEDPVRMESRINSQPPIGNVYRNQPGQQIPLFDGTGAPAGCMLHAAHVLEDPSHTLIMRAIFNLQRALTSGVAGE